MTILDRGGAKRSFPTAAGILFGLGLGGLFDGIVLHQVLQWHHMVSSWYPPTTIPNLELNTLWFQTFARMRCRLGQVYRTWMIEQFTACDAALRPTARAGTKDTTA